jgi:2-dehydro-3-deoxyphosphogluconate aldolase/(4S)-4-hydroxy-2-oxoglutarate aldolase
LTNALIDGGIHIVEITLTTPEAIKAIEEIKSVMGDRALIGVGTVLNREQCRAAIDAGAEFVVSPVTKKEIIDEAHRFGRPVMSGAYTPTEAQFAHEAGSDFIKIFPADRLGPGYIKSLLAPLPHLRIVPTGGVNLETLQGFLKAGCVALGIGSSLISKSILQSDDWAALTRSTVEYVNVLNSEKIG